MSRYFPMPAYPDMMPVDISFVFEDEKPAGKHGFVKADGDDLRFEDGTLARFWGVNFNGGACFPSHDYAEKVARRLAQAGCNIVRFHQLDAEYDTPNIFNFTKGPRQSSSRKLDPRSMEALDYLVYCLKQEGIYCYLDMMTYRHFREEDDVPFVEELMDCAKPWSFSNRHLIELQKEFCKQLWTHKNPYTKLAYKDDPVFVLTEITNENDPFVGSFAKNKVFRWTPYYMNEFRQLFKKWLEDHHKKYDWENCDYMDTSDEMIQFKIDLSKSYFNEMRDYMRKIGVKIPITGTNWSHTYGLLKAHEDMDFTDSHHYTYDWKWGNTERFCKNESIATKADGCRFPGLAAFKMAGKPFFVSEWDMPWPNSYRAEGPIYYAAVGALQGWSGFTIHTYSYGTRLDEMKILGREGSTPIGGIPYREGIFSVWNDPAKFGLFYHAALITRRCDIAPAKEKIAVKAATLNGTPSKAQATLMENHRVATIFNNRKPKGYREIVPSDKAVPSDTTTVPGTFKSDNGQMFRDAKKGLGGIDTERTKVVYGFLGRGGALASTKISAKECIKLTDMEIYPNIDFGVIALSSLTNDPITKSKNMLLSTIGRARNTDPVFDGEKMIDIGKPPIVCEVIDAVIKIRTEVGDKLKVWGVNAEGFYAGQCETSYEDGVLSFRVGDEQNPAAYYLIVAD